MERFDARLIFIEDKDYPEPLFESKTPPVFLFVRGKMPNFHKAIGIVGTRDMTLYGKAITTRLTRDLVKNGFTIVSGLAMGVDARAHSETLNQNGITLAVLGCGIDKLYPAENALLGQRIINNGGAVISEFPLGSAAFKHHFPQRNRIIAGLSRGVVVIEGSKKSGALITARYANEYGRSVFAVPSGVDRLGLSGTNHLIKRSEAKLTESVEDILDDFHMTQQVAVANVTFTDFEKEILGYIKNGDKGMDELAMETPYNVAVLSEVLIGLQLKGIVRQVGYFWVIQ